MNSNYLVATDSEGTIICILLADTYVEKPLTLALQEHYDAEITDMIIDAPDMDFGIKITVNITPEEEDTYEEELYLTPTALYI